MAVSKILVVFGTRPEAVKMAPVIKSLKQEQNAFETRVCVTAQHREMLDQVLVFFSIDADYDLNLMRPNQTLNDLTAAVLKGMLPVLDDFRPDCVLVHGDTTTTMAASLAAFYQRIAVGHVEAGLRTFKKYSPYPEEINRAITTQIATWHFAPTQWAADNLIREQIQPRDIVITGNTVVDALNIGLKKINEAGSPERQKLEGIINPLSRLILVTAHRRENFGEGFEQICGALVEISHDPSVQIIFPVHLNPNVRAVFNSRLAGIANISLIEPQPYENFLFLMSRAYLILTDSGGVQEEAPTLGVPVLLMRDTTERPEGIDAGVVKLVGASQPDIVNAVTQLLNDDGQYHKMKVLTNPFGDGLASKRIAAFLKQSMRNE